MMPLHTRPDARAGRRPHVVSFPDGEHTWTVMLDRLRDAQALEEWVQRGLRLADALGVGLLGDPIPHDTPADTREALIQVRAQIFARMHAAPHAPSDPRRAPHLAPADARWETHPEWGPADHRALVDAALHHGVLAANTAMIRWMLQVAVGAERVEAAMRWHSGLPDEPEIAHLYDLDVLAEHQCAQHLMGARLVATAQDARAPGSTAEAFAYRGFIIGALQWLEQTMPGERPAGLTGAALEILGGMLVHNPLADAAECELRAALTDSDRLQLLRDWFLPVTAHPAHPLLWVPPVAE